jgi:type II secretory ATPase GspE/PulE/Tfp pilus assembly ATPase PilB-like protein
MILGTPAIRASIARSADYPEIQRLAREQGYRTMLEDGKAKVFAGWTTPEEVIKAVYTHTVD